MSRELYSPFKINLSFMRGMVFDTQDESKSGSDDDNNKDEQLIKEYASYKDAIDAEGVGADVMINGQFVKAVTADNYKGNNVWGDTSDTDTTTGNGDELSGLDEFTEELNTGGDNIGATDDTIKLAEEYYETGDGKDGATTEVDYSKTNSGHVFNPTAGDDDGDTLAAAISDLTITSNSSAEDEAAWLAKAEAEAETLKKFTTNETSGLDDLAGELFSDGVYNQGLVAGADPNNTTTDLAGLALSGDELAKTVEYDNASNVTGINGVDMSTTNSGEEFDETAGAEDLGPLDQYADETFFYNGESYQGSNAFGASLFESTRKPGDKGYDAAAALAIYKDAVSGQYKLDGVNYATKAEYDAAVKFKAEQGSYDEEPAVQTSYFKRLQPDGTYTYRKVEGFGRTADDLDATQGEYEAFLEADTRGEDLANGEEGFSMEFNGVTYTNEAAYYAAVQAAENGEDVFSKELDGVTYTNEAEYNAAVKFKAEQGSYDEEPAFQYKGVTYATQAEYDAAVAADEAVTDTGFSEVFNGVTYTDEDAYYKAVQAAENGEDVFSKVFEGVTYTDEAAYNAAVLAAASNDDEGGFSKVFEGVTYTDEEAYNAAVLAAASDDDEGGSSKVLEDVTYTDPETSELIFPFTYRGVTYNTQEELDAAFNNGDGFTYNGVTYATQAEYEAAVLAGANAADDSLTLDGVTYATQAEYEAAVAAANAAASNDGVDGGVVADTNQDGEITKLEAEIKDLREKLGLLTDTSTGETEGMTKDEIIAAINEAMENFNGNDYDPAAFMNAFGFAMNPTYFGNTIPTYMSENGVYTRRAVKDKDTGETRYVNVPIANQGGQVSQYRQNRRKGFGSLV